MVSRGHEVKSRRRRQRAKCWVGLFAPGQESGSCRDAEAYSQQDEGNAEGPPEYPAERVAAVVIRCRREEHASSNDEHYSEGGEDRVLDLALCVHRLILTEPGAHSLMVPRVELLHDQQRHS